ncbi:MAG TPA: glycosyltransferase [Chroococcidiopsis sp.]
MSHPTDPGSASISAPSNGAFPAARASIPRRQAIALISDYGDPAVDIGKDEAGGQTIYVRQVGEALAKLGWQVDMFTRKVHPDAPSIVEHSPYCRTIRLVAGPEEPVPKNLLFQHMPEFVSAFRKFQAKESLNYPLIHTNYWTSGWVGLQLKAESSIQLIHTYHSLGAVKYQAIGPRPAIADTRLAIERQLLNHADCVVATSPQEDGMLRSLVSGDGYVEVVPCGADIDTFHSIPKAEARAKLGFSPEQQIILYVGRFDPRKGLDTLMQAFAALKQGEHGAIANPANLRLVIVGGNNPDPIEGRDRLRIRNLVRDLGIADQTSFAGVIGHDLLPLYYTAADLCVIPSHYEPFGLVAIEAMACGTPVVASDVGGLRFTVIPEETGLLVPPQEVEAFVNAIARILSDEIWARKLRRQASSRVQQNFSWNSVGVKLSDLYRRLLVQSLTQEPLRPPSVAPVVPAIALPQPQTAIAAKRA